MLKQLDSERNLVLVMSANEAGRVQDVLQGAIEAMSVGLVAPHKEVVDVMGELSSAMFLYTDEEITEALVSMHLNHTEDNVEGMRAAYAKRIPEARAATEGKGLILAPDGE